MPNMHMRGSFSTSVFNNYVDIQSAREALKRWNKDGL